LNHFCGKESEWGLPEMKETPAPTDYVYSKMNRPNSNEDQKEILKHFNGLSMSSAVSSLLYIALNTRCDILWVVNKLAKSSMQPGIKDFEALMHCFGYLRRFPDYAIKFNNNVNESPVHKICTKHKVPFTELIGFSDSSWQDCPDTGRSTAGYKVFIKGNVIDADSSMPVPVAFSSAEAEYMGACNLGAIISHLRELLYEFEYLGTEQYEIDGIFGETPSMKSMSKNYKVTSKNRHVGRRWHFLRRGTIAKMFQLLWVPDEDQLAVNLTKTQTADKSKTHFNRTLVKIPNKV
jgi:hypothetical protein